MRSLPALALAIFCCTVIAVPVWGRGAGDETPSSQALLEKGRAQIVGGDLSEAIRTLTLAREAAPEEPAVYTALADAYLKQGAEAMGVEQLRRSLQLDSLQVEPRLRLAEIDQRNRRWAEAGRHYQQVLRQDPANDVAALQLGKLYHMAKQPGASAKALAGYVQRHPEDSEVVSQYLDDLAGTNQLAALAAAGAEVLRTRADWTPALLATARGLAGTDQCARALEYYQKADAVQPLQGADAVAVGRCHLAMKDDAQAATWFERTLQEPSSSVDWAEPASAFMRLKRWPQAAQCYERKLAQDSTSVSALVNVALCRQQLKDYEASRLALRRAVLLRPEFVAAQYSLATNYVLQDSTRAARRTYGAVIRLASGQETEYRQELLQAYRYLSVGDLLDKDWAQAVPNLDRVLDLDPSDVEMRLYRAQALVSLNRKAEAKRDYEVVLQQHPDNKLAKKGLDLLAQYN